ncbi:MAG: hypothetical protein WCG31_02485 [Deltaproteobacteria bacterium]|jgi:hypothetical protein
MISFIIENGSLVGNGPVLAYWLGMALVASSGRRNSLPRFEHGASSQKDQADDSREKNPIFHEKLLAKYQESQSEYRFLKHIIKSV